MAVVPEDKCESTSTSERNLSRENSLSSLPDTECEWPETTYEWPDRDGSLQRPPTPEILLPTGPPGHFMPSVDTAQLSYFQVAYPGGVEVRAGAFNAPQTGLILRHNEVFAVTEQLVGSDGIVYLRMADGRGWVFDDTKLMPHDPSVVRCTYTASQDRQPCPPVVGSSALGSIPPPPLSPPELKADMILPTASTMPASTMLPPARPEILASTPASAAPVMAAPPPSVHRQPSSSSHLPASPPVPVSWYRVSHMGGISLRSGPSIQAPLTGAVLPCNETFPVAEEVPCSDGRVYLRLCDGRGWVFDDNALMPLDPSVRRGSWMSMQSAGWQLYFPSSYQDGQVDAYPSRRRRMYPQPRGKRGGKRCSKRKQNQQNNAAAGAAIEG